MGRAYTRVDDAITVAKRNAAKMYSRWDLNPRPRACEARALDGRIGKPTELRLQEELIFDVGANNFKVVI